MRKILCAQTDIDKIEILSSFIKPRQSEEEKKSSFDIEPMIKKIREDSSRQKQQINAEHEKTMRTLKERGQYGGLYSGKDSKRKSGHKKRKPIGFWDKKGYYWDWKTPHWKTVNLKTCYMVYSYDEKKVVDAPSPQRLAEQAQ